MKTNKNSSVVFLTALWVVRELLINFRAFSLSLTSSLHYDITLPSSSHNNGLLLRKKSTFDQFSSNWKPDNHQTLAVPLVVLWFVLDHHISSNKSFCVIPYLFRAARIMVRQSIDMDWTIQRLLLLYLSMVEDLYSTGFTLVMSSITNQ